MVSRNRVVTRHFDAARIRSWLRISLLTAAAISGVRPCASLANTGGVAASESSQSRKSPDRQGSPTVRAATGRKASASWPSQISRVTSSSS